MSTCFSKTELSSILIAVLGGIFFVFLIPLQDAVAQVDSAVQIYENKELGISVSYPLSFIKVEENSEPGALVLYTASEEEIFSNIFFEYTLVNGPMEEFLQPTIDQLRLDFNNFLLVESEVISVAGEPAMKLLYTTTDLGFNAEIIQVILSKNKIDYYFTFGTTFERFDENLPIIQEIINSIEIDNVEVPILLYENPTYEFKLKHPANFFKYDDPSLSLVVGFVSPYKNLEDTSPEEVNIVVLKDEEFPPMEEIDGLIENEYPRIIKNFNMIELQPTTISGIPAKKLVFTGKIPNPFIDTSGIPLVGDHPVFTLMNLALSEEIEAKATQIFFLKDDKMYILTYRASPDDYDSFLPEAQKIIDSFELEGVQVPSYATIPDWIRNNAEWWAQGAIGDSDFVSGIQYLIKEGIMQIPETSTSSTTGESNEIPSWIKNNADWWSQGLISDDDFVKGIQYLVESGIIIV